MIYIAHPYSDNPEKRLKQVDKICKEVRKEGYIPISPLHLFSFVEAETPGLRERILEICKELIDWVVDSNEAKGYDAPHIRFYNYDNALSSGQAMEYRHCYKHKYIMEFENVD